MRDSVTTSCQARILANGSVSAKRIKLFESAKIIVFKHKHVFVRIGLFSLLNKAVLGEQKRFFVIDLAHAVFGKQAFSYMRYAEVVFAFRHALPTKKHAESAVKRASRAAEILSVARLSPILFFGCLDIYESGVQVHAK